MIPRDLRHCSHTTRPPKQPIALLTARRQVVAPRLFLIENIQTTMVRLLLTLSVVGAAYLLAPCCASVIKTANEARLASRELFYYYDIDSSMSMPCSKIAKSKKGQHPPPPPPKSKKGVYPPPTKHPKGCKHTKVPKGKGKGGKGKGGAPASKAPTHTTPPIPNSKFL